MKKELPGIFLFLFAMVFLLLGLFSKDFLPSLQTTADSAFQSVSFTEGAKAFTSTAEQVLPEKLLYHHEMMDLNSVRENLMGTRMIQKEDGTRIVKADSGSLLLDTRPIWSDADMQWMAMQAEPYYREATSHGCAFLYCPVPTKTYYETTPSNVPDATRRNFDGTLLALEEQGIPTVNLPEAFKESEAGDSLYFITDHHWKPSTGLLAASAICKELQKRYGFSYDLFYTDPAQYEIQTYKDWFLGSAGKKVGLWFTWDGADDFDLILPRFATSLTEDLPLTSSIRTGTFQEVLLYTDYLYKDYYGMNNYAVYSGGDFRLQIIRNNLNPEGKKILIIRDSYACAVTPFLALQARELHILDDRPGGYPEGEIIDLPAYLDEVKPDYVILLKSL